MKDNGIDPREPAGLRAALLANRDDRRGKPTEADRPPLSLFPMTPAARAAQQMEMDARRGRKR